MWCGDECSAMGESLLFRFLLLLFVNANRQIDRSIRCMSVAGMEEKVE
jgi:hypothetical protein